MSDIGIGIIGGGYMGKAHSVAFASVASVFDTELRPRLVTICASTPESAEIYRKAYGFEKATSNWREMVADSDIQAIVIASPQATHHDIALAALAAGKPVLCEKPLGISLEQSRSMVAAAKAAGISNMVGFNYIRTPASQQVRKFLAEGRIGEVTWFRGEMTEDFFADPEIGGWRAQGAANGTMGDLAPHMINAAHAFMGPIKTLSASVETVHKVRDGQTVTNDDQAQMMCRFESGAQGHMFFSRVATGRKMGYAYEIHGTKGHIRFDQEDQNALWLYTTEGPQEERGFRKILTGPAHPDYLPFCQGPGHGTGYQDQIIIEAKDFLTAIAENRIIWPTFEEGMEVNRIVTAALDSSIKQAWVTVADY
ncbi:MAG: Gfo/Idh/MocA family oxidoreductase [Planktomarina sp.]|jgi:predicted dehydrogenase|nr:Gfo/Idh/MocA family oxidoreductase [Planktomarina sp.]MDT2057454.1 Gfo/Idh/MocA family oxidoreductase [Planktomarina sp.]MDT2073596.1 Gfo/Idh/MocA family oxidoreductase [Planktomarina sp.]HAJ84566.1 oxidoreductase [Paracoccaceae bacterium]|tara:strand:- start:2975 stop:4075 length:1101 start_codon:yes stop_codon:yes gene_type:complete